MLNHAEIVRLIKKNKLITGCINQDTQLTPNGLDLTVEKIFRFTSSGALDFSNKEREIPAARELLPKKKGARDKFGWWNLKQGIYKVRTNETVNLPLDLIALAFSRTSLLRMGAFTEHGVWDAGFKGKSEFVLVVENPKGIRLKANCRIAQLVFLRINEAVRGYQGVYQNYK